MVASYEQIEQQGGQVIVDINKHICSKLPEELSEKQKNAFLKWFPLGEEVDQLHWYFLCYILCEPSINVGYSDALVKGNIDKTCRSVLAAKHLANSTLCRTALKILHNDLEDDVCQILKINTKNGTMIKTPFDKGCFDLDTYPASSAYAAQCAISAILNHNNPSKYICYSIDCIAQASLGTKMDGKSEHLLCFVKMADALCSLLKALPSMNKDKMLSLPTATKKIKNEQHSRYK